MNAPEQQTAVRAFDVTSVRADFPALQTTSRGKPLVFLDSGASAQKPRAVINAISRCYASEYANIHRGVYELSQKATENYEGARAKVARFMGAAKASEIVFTRNATEGVNLVAQSWGRANLKPGDEILITGLEHHANIVPWQMLRDQLGLVLKHIPLNDRGELRLDLLPELLTERTKLVAVSHMSNALGTIVPVAGIIAAAHKVGAKVLVDGAQAIVHFPVNVQALDADFYVWTGHKLFGPSGIGVLYGKQELLKDMPPYQGGGDMILTVTLEKSTYAEPPARFEAGTPHIAGAVGLAAAIDYVTQFDPAAVAAHEALLQDAATEALRGLNGVQLVGTAENKGAILSFVMDGVHPHDVGTILDMEGIAVRTGHHCAQPVMDHFDIPATTRASFAMYNTLEDVEGLVRGLRKVQEIFA